MKYFILTALLTLGFGCSSNLVDSRSMPDEFWGYGSWRFDVQEQKLHDGTSGVAMIKVKFTRINGDQYEIFGDVTYVDDTMRCDEAQPTSRICPKNTCTFESADPGTIAGVAEVTDGVLTLKPVWNDEDIPEERVSFSCKTDGDMAHDTASVRTTMDLYAAGFVNTTWTMDVDGVTFIDDLPDGEVTDEKTAFKNFETEYGLINAEGLFALYRNEPL
ncbi:MAG: hypothetical protein ACD_41C00266G0001 [uncultured bacterium]|nr:MAG: hypothetical protein ACD_41C00266G0001 [uncultured bacterium]HBY73151.1 hypothetical protein [Candidatus Kerfeldbacteria bacterium]